MKSITTKIYADYLCKYELPEDLSSCLYFFCVKDSTPKIEDEYKGCSFFKRHETDFTRGTSKTKLLLSKKIIKIETGDIQEEELFRHKNYIEEM